MARQGRQAGETLVETLLSVILLGLLGAGIVTAMASVISVSDFDARQSTAETVLRSYAQAWSRAPYVPCTASQTTNPYTGIVPPGFTEPSGYDASVPTTTFWDGGSSSTITFGATCPATGDAGLQALNLRVDPPRGPALNLTIEKRTP